MVHPPDRDPRPAQGGATELPTIDARSGPAAETGRPGVSSIPARIGRYTIKRLVASGGMGTIYEGVQEQPRRTVAIKVMKHGVASREALRRFEYESQLLARLRHPGIAQVYEAGTHDDGSGSVPYFAMEYIPNAKSITSYCDDRKLGVRERMELFGKVCDAVHHGHQRGIIHRDLKPSNILVDSSGMPRIIDFGVARATDSDMALATVQTEVGQLVGSLQYMSPEQFEADPNDIDTRSDVYALGVVLYELLGGQLPYDVSTTTVFEAAKMVREKDPLRLSACRPELRGEVEIIVHKALCKDRDQRYQSAYGLAQDIRRYLAGEAIAARPPSITYQFRVFARRNRALLGSVAAVFVVLVAATVISITLYLRAEQQRARAEMQTGKAQAAVEFLREMLSTAAPDEYGKEATISDLLEVSRQQAGGAFKDDPEIEAEIRRTIAYGYLNLGAWRPAETELERAFELRERVLGAADPRTLESLQDLAVVYEVLGRNDELVQVQRSIVSLQAAALGENHPTTLQAFYDLAEHQLAAGQLAGADSSSRRALAGRRSLFGGEHTETLESRAQHAWVQVMQGRLAEGERESREVLDACLRTLGESHDVTRLTRSVLSGALITEGKFSEAAQVYGGRRAPPDLGIVTKFQGAPVPARSATQLLVFWETWCPFSQRAVPELEKVYERHQRDLEVVALTRVSRSSSDAKVRSFISDNRLSFEVAKEDGSASSFFGVRGTPWITILRGGVMVWEKRTNTPEVVPEEMLTALAKR